MLHFYSILVLLPFFICSQSIDIQNKHLNRTIVPSRTIYDLVQIRRAGAKFAALRNRTHRNATTNDFRQLVLNAVKVNNDLGNTNEHDMKIFKKSYHRILDERLKLMIIIISVSVGLMIIIVIMCIVRKYYEGRIPMLKVLKEQTEPLQSPRHTESAFRYSYRNTFDERNFGRKTRTIPTSK